MLAPSELAFEEVICGDSYRPVHQFVIGDSVLNMAEVGVVGRLRLVPEDGGSEFKRATDTPGETALVTDGLDGKVQFNFLPSETVESAIPPGWYQVFIESTKGTPATLLTHARGAIKFTARSARPY